MSLGRLLSISGLQFPQFLQFSPKVKKEVIFALSYRDIITIKHVSVYIKETLHVLKLYTNIRYYFPIVTRTIKAFSIKI